MKTCIECGTAFSDGPGRKGYVNRCDECSKPKPSQEQRGKWDADEDCIVTNEGERLQFEVVGRLLR